MLCAHLFIIYLNIERMSLLLCVFFDNLNSCFFNCVKKLKLYCHCITVEGGQKDYEHNKRIQRKCVLT